MSEEKPKEGVKTENDHINLKVAGQDGSVVQFKIKRHTPLSKLMKAYCERQGLSMRQIRFRFDGQPINETDTPAQLEMEDEDTIGDVQQQTGGHVLGSEAQDPPLPSLHTPAQCSEVAAQISSSISADGYESKIKYCWICEILVVGVKATSKCKKSLK
ncbi:LOW QUALITY PROTEIN: small ubiquitin-related modifier 3 [Papio anubis]|uniref:LOW QUALITY PROTEIN: small ubiquitin-related modifier 3 n=1 Tax=Papio anubis TaxID=9555 RepID=UPI0012AEAAAA|nr:LOW QUALITY PROTEIN: small ubiquitin-related modifier 3 [Papio anubis]